MPTKKTFEETLLLFKNIHGETYDYSLVTEIKNHATKVPIKCHLHGVFFMSANTHIFRKSGCMKCSKISRSSKIIDNKRKEFVSKANLRHNNRYNYSKTDYKGYLEKIIIICNEHGEFEQYPRYHIAGNGCPKCASGGFKKSDFARCCKNSAFVYITKCFNDSEQFLKIGITGQKEVSNRFSSKEKMPYNYEVISYYENTAELIWEYEKELHRKFKEYKYTPKLKFSGSSECFKVSNEIINFCLQCNKD